MALLCVVLVAVMMCLIVCTLNSPPTPRTELLLQGEREEQIDAVGDRVNSLSLNCAFQDLARVPAFSMNGDVLIGGVFTIHTYIDVINLGYTTKPKLSKCTGR